MQKRNLEKVIAEKISKLTKACTHGKLRAWIYPFECEKCSLDYVRYCIKNNETFEDRQEYKVALEIVKTESRKEVEKQNRQAEKLQKEQDQQEAVERGRKERQQKREAELNLLKDQYGTELAKYISDRHLSSEELGKRYERYIGYLYEIQDYNVEYHGIKKGMKDGGIDLIAKAKNHEIIVQCKRRGQNSQIHENTINQLIGTLSTYKINNQGRRVESVLYTQNNNLDDEARKTLLLHADDIVHNVKVYPFDIGEAYPLIKCNIGQNNEKIYHLPMDAMYDRIKIEIKKGELYVYTEQEAKNLGFRRAKN